MGFDSLEDFFLAGERTVDGQLDSGWASVPVIGREVEGAVLVARMECFEARSSGLDPAETLAFLNSFFSRMDASALREGYAIAAGCRGGELTLLFAAELGSGDPFGEALAAARQICEWEAAGFAPRVGVAAGELIVGYVGTPLRYEASLLGRPLAEAERCAGVEPKLRHPAPMRPRSPSRRRTGRTAVSQTCSDPTGGGRPTGTWKSGVTRGRRQPLARYGHPRKDRSWCAKPSPRCPSWAMGGPRKKFVRLCGGCGGVSADRRTRSPSDLLLSDRVWPGAQSKNDRGRRSLPARA